MSRAHQGIWDDEVQISGSFSRQALFISIDMAKGTNALEQGGIMGGGRWVRASTWLLLHGDTRAR